MALIWPPQETTIHGGFKSLRRYLLSLKKTMYVLAIFLSGCINSTNSPIEIDPLPYVREDALDSLYPISRIADAEFRKWYRIRNESTISGWPHIYIYDTTLYLCQTDNSGFSIQKIIIRDSVFTSTETVFENINCNGPFSDIDINFCGYDSLIATCFISQKSYLLDLRTNSKTDLSNEIDIPRDFIGYISTAYSKELNAILTFGGHERLLNNTTDTYYSYLLTPFDKTSYVKVGRSERYANEFVGLNFDRFGHYAYAIGGRYGNSKYLYRFSSSDTSWWPICTNEIFSKFSCYWGSKLGILTDRNLAYILLDGYNDLSGSRLVLASVNLTNGELQKINPSEELPTMKVYGYAIDERNAILYVWSNSYKGEHQTYEYTSLQLYFMKL